MRTRLQLALAITCSLHLACSETPTELGKALAVRLDAPAAVVSGSPVLLRLTVTNVSDRPVATILSCSGFEIEVVESGGNVVYRSYDQPRFSCGIMLELAPGQSRVLTLDWLGRTQDSQRVSAGTYGITASLWRSLSERVAVSQQAMVVVQQP